MRTIATGRIARQQRRDRDNLARLQAVRTQSTADELEPGSNAHKKTRPGWLTRTGFVHDFMVVVDPGALRRRLD